MTQTHADSSTEAHSRLQSLLSGVLRLTRAVVSDAEVYGRHKSRQSARTKAERLNLEPSVLLDLIGVRVLVSDIEDCYRVIEVLQRGFCHLPQQSDDYIRNPKSNGYRSLHTVLLDRVGLPIEVQVRTRQMHDCAQWGSAAHARYKQLQSI